MTKNTVREIKKIIIFAAFVFLCLWRHEAAFAIFREILTILAPFIAGTLIAIVLNIPMMRIERRLGTKRLVSLLFTLLLLFFFLTMLFYVILPQLSKTTIRLADHLREFFPVLQKEAERISAEYPQVRQWISQLDWNEGMVTGKGIGMLRSLIRAVTVLFVGFAFACYCLLDKEHLIRQGKMVLYAFLPRGKADALLEVLVLASQTFSGFLTGQCLEAVTLGTLFAVTLLLLRIPYALLISLLIGAASFVPIFGAFAACGLGVVLIWTEDPRKALLFLGVFLLLQQIDGNFIYPRVVGNSVGLSPIWVLSAVSVGGTLFGVPGMLLFIPLASVSYALFREVVYLLLRKQELEQNENNGN